MSSNQAQNTVLLMYTVNRFHFDTSHPRCVIYRNEVFIHSLVFLALLEPDSFFAL